MTAEPTGASRKARDRALLVELQRALERGEVIPYYQPIVSLRQNTIERLEVLARWRHPDRGILEPESFMRAVERGALGGRLMEVLLGQAIPDLARWRAYHPDLRVSLNLSAHDLRGPGLTGQIARRLRALNADGTWIAVEITENMLVSDTRGAQQQIAQLKALGTRVEIDDFGTGYSSLRYLQTLPVDAVKIDRQFVIDLLRDAQSEVIVRAVIRMCHELGFETVAEGVEQRPVWDVLKALGCDAAQGYMISPPLPAAEISGWLAASPQRSAMFSAHPSGHVPGVRGPILVVDDEPEIAALISDVLEEHGYRVERAANGQEALAAISRERPSLVLLDVHMPIMDAEGFVKAIRSRGLDLPFVVVTAGPSADHWAQRLHARAAVQKPFQIADLLSVADRFAEHARN